jgi:hypothetical protein
MAPVFDHNTWLGGQAGQGQAPETAKPGSKPVCLLRG